MPSPSHLQSSNDNNALLYKRFLNFLNTNQQSGNTSSVSTSTINFIIAFNTPCPQLLYEKHVWIIDTRTSVHMYITLNIFH